MDRKFKIAFFDSKPYDIKSFEETNEKYGFNIKFFRAHLTNDTVALAAGYNWIR